MKYFFLALIMIAGLDSYPQALSNHYQINVEVEPAKGYLKADCRLQLVADKAITEIAYWLHSAFQPVEVTGKEVDSVWVTDLAGTSSTVKEVHIRFKKELSKGSESIIHFAYEGMLDASQFIDRGTFIPAWSELSIGAVWYPISLEESLLTYDINLTAPSQYTVESAGEITQIQETQWKIREETVTPGRIIIMLSDQLHKVRTQAEAYTVDFYVLEPEDPLLDSLQQYTRQLLSFFDDRFGAVESTTNQIKIFFPNRDIEGVSNGGFSNNGKFIMLNNQRDADRQYYLLSHEIAHFWWRYGELGSYHEFLNEGLAEFSKMLAHREKYGEEKLSTLVSSYQTQTKELESIRSWDHSNIEERRQYLYLKAALLMWNLLGEVGEEKVYAILRRTTSEKISRYEDFLRIIEEETDPRTAREFDQQF